MWPILIDFGNVDLPLVGEVHLLLPSYGALFAVAIACGWFWFDRRARTLDIDGDTRFNLVFYSLAAGVLGAKATLVALDPGHYLSDPAELLRVLRSGGVLLGGVALGALTFVFYARHRGLQIFRLLDALAAPLLLAQGFGRLACFCAGCCWGAECSPDFPFAVVFDEARAHDTTGVPLDRPLYPVQLFELVADLLLVIPITALWKRRPEPAGTVWWWYVALYGAARFGLEFFRGDSHRGLWLGDALSTSQLLALAGVLIAAVALVRGRKSRST